MGGGDDRAFGDLRMGHGGVFQINGTDPLATGFHQILGPVDDHQKAVGADRGDVTGAEPPLVINRRRARRLIIEITIDDAGTAHRQFADRFTVMG